MRGRGEGVVRAFQFGEALRTFDDITGEDVAQHRRLSGARRPVDPHQTTLISQIFQGLVDGELLTQCQAVFRVGRPATFRQPVDSDSCVGNGVVPDNVRPLPHRKISVGGQVLRQCLRAFPIGQPSRDGCEIVKEEAVEKVDVRARIVGTTAGDGN